MLVFITLVLKIVIQIQLLLKLNQQVHPALLHVNSIQIQLLLKLNDRKISICDFYYTIKSIDIQGY